MIEVLCVAPQSLITQPSKPRSFLRLPRVSGFSHDQTPLILLYLLRPISVSVNLAPRISPKIAPEFMLYWPEQVRAHDGGQACLDRARERRVVHFEARPFVNELRDSSAVSLLVVIYLQQIPTEHTTVNAAATTTRTPKKRERCERRCPDSRNALRSRRRCCPGCP
jgi:hypothetical protein